MFLPTLGWTSLFLGLVGVSPYITKQLVVDPHMYVPNQVIPFFNARWEHLLSSISIDVRTVVQIRGHPRLRSKNTACHASKMANGRV